jgi:hypothetical protein
VTVLVVAHPFDAVAQGVVDRLRDRSATPVVVTPSQLCGGVVTYRNVAGRARWAVDLGDRVLRSEEVRGALNRARFLEPTGFADPDDETYAACERAALYAAMVESIDGTVLNRSTGATLAGPARSPVELLLAAARHGLPAPRIRMSRSGTEVDPVRRELCSCVVLDGRAHGAPDDGLARGSVALAGELGCGFLQLRLAEGGDGRCVVAAVEPFPEQVAAATLDLLAAHLGGGAA